LEFKAQNPNLKIQKLLNKSDLKQHVGMEVKV